MFTTGHSGVTGKERADSWADEAVLDNNLSLDAPTVIQIVTEQLIKNRPKSSSHTLDRLKEKGICPGDGAKSDNRGFLRRINNQLLMDTVSLQTLRASLKMRSEQVWLCATCQDDNADPSI